ncbi:hypothetical protein [Streptomyces sp. SID3343]|uniref:hypothetical protein n=1 Tax=Streptomyces sp. SID3343 TaxID=2690260 RepID=UPI001369B363|nr:hypothetical protein [Streptomyces sp. SID3343]MYW03374.1 hypothetical protein [Streptomyces sp. SID3343]MYW06220.1 hypothetical protein [Streptomyces sp. SID3343]
MAPTPQPEVSVGLHPQFGIVALTTDNAPPLAARLLDIAGFDARGVGTHVLDYADEDVLDLRHAHNVVTVLREAGIPVRSDLPPTPEPRFTAAATAAPTDTVPVAASQPPRRFTTDPVTSTAHAPRR